MKALRQRSWALLPAALAGALPTLFIPISVDAYILPRTALALAGAGAGAAIGLWAPAARLGALRLPALAVVAAAAVAAVLSASPYLSLAGAYTRYEDLPVRVAYVGLFAASVWLLRSSEDRRLVVTMFLLGSAVAAAEALYQAATGTHFRPDGNLGQPNLLGALLAMACPLALVRGRSDRRWWALLPLLAAGLVACVSRSGWVGAVAGSAAAALLLAGGRRAVLGALGSVLALSVLALLLTLTPLRGLNQDTGSARAHLWRDVAHLVAARPLAGWGEDSLGLEIGAFLSGDWEPGNTFDRAHSQPLDMLSTQGALGLAACAWFWILFAATAWRWRRLEEVAGLLGAAAAYSTWALVNFDWAPATGPFWLLSGVAWSAAAAQPAARRVPPLAAAAAAVALAAAVAATAVLPVLADLDYYAGRLDLSVRLDPWQARYHQALGETLSGRRRADELGRAARLGGYDPTLYVELGDAELGLNDREAARRAYREALRIDPYDAAARSRLAALGA